MNNIPKGFKLTHFFSPLLLSTVEDSQEFSCNHKRMLLIDVKGKITPSGI